MSWSLEEDQDNPIPAPSYSTVSSILSFSQRLGSKTLVERVRQLDKFYREGMQASLEKDVRH